MDAVVDVGLLKHCMNAAAAKAVRKHVSGVATGVQQSVSRALTAMIIRGVLDICYSEETVASASVELPE